MTLFETLLLSAVSLLTLSMFIFFYLFVFKSQYQVSTPKPDLKAQFVKENTPSNCAHQFGFLKTYPRNQPIPEECFGCTEMLRCFEHWEIQ